MPEEEDSKLKPLANPEYLNQLRVDPETGKLYWRRKEIVARNTIDFSGISRVWTWVTGIAIGVGGLVAALNGLADLNKEFCVFKVGSCQVSAHIEDRHQSP
jgi:hypothetical protein